MSEAWSKPTHRITPGAAQRDAKSEGPAGGRVDGAVGLLTVTVTAEDVVKLPEKSLANAVKVCEALVAPVVFQETEYGADMTSVPRFCPSSLNWTPMMPTLSVAV